MDTMVKYTSSNYFFDHISKNSQWGIYSRDAVEFFRRDQKSMDTLAYFEFSFIPDEGFFCTALLNNKEQFSKIINDNKRFLKFQNDWAPHPIWLGMPHLPEFEPSKLYLNFSQNSTTTLEPNGTPEPRYLFMRKVDVIRQTQFIEYIEKEVWEKNN